MVSAGVLTSACAKAPFVCQKTGASAAPRRRLRRENPVLKSICNVDPAHAAAVYAANVKLALRVGNRGVLLAPGGKTLRISNVFRRVRDFCRGKIQPIKSFNWTAFESRRYDCLGLIICCSAAADSGIWKTVIMKTINAMDSSVSLLHRVSGIVSSNLSLDEMLGEIVGLAAQVTECDACLVYLMDHESNEIVLRASQVPHAKDLGELRLKIGEGVTGWVAEHKSVVALGSNAAADPRFKRFQTLIEDTYEAFVSVPIVSGGEVIGVINVHHREAHTHSPEEVSLLVFIGEQMGGVVSKSLLEEEKAKLLEEAATFRRQLEERKQIGRAHV